MGCGVSKPVVVPLTSLGSWGVGGPSLAYDVYGPKPRVIRGKNKFDEMCQLLVYAEDGQKALPEDEHRRLMCGMAFFTERQSANLATAARHQWALTVCSQLDMVVERELLQSDSYVLLRKLSRVVGMDLEWCDQRWEHDQERDANHSGASTRIRETMRAVQNSAGPATIVLLGEKLGRPSLPEKIDAMTFEAFLVQIAKGGRTGEKLANSYVKDTNEVPPVYRLQRIDKLLPRFLDMDHPDQRRLAEEKWNKEYLTPMLEDIQLAVQGMMMDGSISQMDADTFLYPPGIQEALRGVLLDASMGPGKKATRSILVNRSFGGINAADSLASQYIDWQATGLQDTQAAVRLERVRATLRGNIPDENVLDFSVAWDSQGLEPADEKHRTYLADFGNQVTESVVKMLANQVARRPKLSSLEYEVFQHTRWLETHSNDLIGRSVELQRVKDFLQETSGKSIGILPRHPGRSMVITGAEGCGKTKLLCAAVSMVSRAAPKTVIDSAGSLQPEDHLVSEPIIVFRALGFSHSLRTGRDIMHSVCQQLASVLKSTEPVPIDYKELVVKFGMLLAEASENRRVIVILDNLDQLDAVEEGSPCLHWLPVDSLPDNCSFLTTVSSSDSLTSNWQVYEELQERLKDESQWLAIPALRPEETTSLLEYWLNRDKRDLTALQKALLVGTASAAQDGATASVLELGYCVSRTWSSSHSPPSISVSPNIKASLHELFVWLESTFTPRLVSNVLGAMSIAKAGLSRAEIIDIASTDDALLRDLFKWAVPPFARVPPSAVANVLHAVDSLVEERALHKCAPVLQWTNSSYRWHCKTRYDSTGLRRRMYQYFSGSASCQFKPLSVTCQDFSVMLSVDRQIADMPNIISLGNSKHRINQRKLTEIVPLMEGLNKWDDMTSFFCDMQVFDSLCSPAHITVYAAGWKSIISKHGEKGPEVIWEGLRSTVEKIDDYKERSALAHRIANFANVELGMPELSLRFLETSLHALVHQGSEDLEIANILEEIARIQYKAGEMESAISKLDEVLAIRSNEYLPDHQKLTGPLTLQGEIFLKSGKTEEAMKRYNEVLRRLRGLERSECRLVVADITTRVAEIYKNLDERDRAIACHEEALRIRKAVLDPDHLEVAINVSALAILYERRGDLANALSRFAEALQIRRSRLGPCHIDVASLYNNMAVVYERLGKLPEATKKYELALGVFRTKLGKNHMVVGTIYNNLGNVYKMQGAFAKAVESYQASLIIRRKALGKSLLVADTLNSLAGVHLLRGEFDRSLECCEESKLIREDLCGKDHVDVATMLNNIAGVLLKKGECDDSVEKLCTDAYKIKVEAYGEDHVQVAEILNNIAMLKDLRGEKDKALEITQEALKIQEALVGKNHISTAQTLHCKALFLRRNGDLDASAAICKEAIKARKALLGEDHLDVAHTLHVLAEVRHLQGNHEKALETVAQALSIRRTKLGSEHVDVAACLHLAGKIYNGLDRQDDALQSFSEALAIRRNAFGNGNQDVAGVLKDIALLHWNRDMFQEALRAMEEAVDIYQRTKAVDKLEIANTLNSLAALYWNQGEFDRAEDVTLESLELRKEMLGADHADIAETLINLANVLESKGETEQALDRCKEALNIFIGRSDSETSEMAQLHAQMGVLYRAISEDDLAQYHLKRSVAIFEKIAGADHRETQEAQDALSTSTTPAANTTASTILSNVDVKTTAMSQEPALSIGWAENVAGSVTAIPPAVEPSVVPVVEP